MTDARQQQQEPVDRSPRLRFGHRGLVVGVVFGAVGLLLSHLLGGGLYAQILCAIIGLLAGWLAGEMLIHVIDRQLTFKSFSSKMEEIIQKTLKEEIGECSESQAKSSAALNAVVSDHTQKISTLIEKRLATVLRSHALFTRRGRFESIVRWLEQDHHEDVKWIIAKVISRKLEHAFNVGDRIEIQKQEYKDHSQLFAQLVDEATDVCLTCIYSPVRWFAELPESKVAHTVLPDRIQEAVSSKFAEGELKQVSANGQLRYPEHFIKFLDNPQRGIRRRVFLLNEKEWLKLIDKTSAPYFKKFVLPCEVVRVETRFVHAQELESRTADVSEEDKQVVSEAQEKNLFSADYDIFNHQAVMSYDAVRRKLHFRVDGVEMYEEFLDLIFRLTPVDGGGIYTIGMVAQKLDVEM